MQDLSILHKETSYQNISENIKNLRETFGRVFSEHYAKKLKDSNLRVGFQDLIDKYFNGDIDIFTEEEVKEKLYQLYSGAGFDDEAAFLKSWIGLKESGKSALELYYERCNNLTSEERKEIIAYQKSLEAENRELKDVGVVKLVDEKNKVQGFMLYHLFYTKEGKEILHVRQAAISEKNKGYGMRMAKVLCDTFPNAYFEANQRRGNFVPPLDRPGIFSSQYPTTLGYSESTYKGIGSMYTLAKSWEKYSNAKTKQIETPETEQRITARL